MILRNFISPRVFTASMENSLRFEISLQLIWRQWNMHRSGFHFDWSLVNANNEVTLHRGESLLLSEFSNRFEFILGLM